MQGDGNAVWYDSIGSVVWASNSNQPNFQHSEHVPEYLPPTRGQLTHHQQKDRLVSGQELKDDERIWSTNGCFHFIMQTDGNAVLYRAGAPFDVNNSFPLWASNTHDRGSRPYNFIMQPDGNAVLYTNRTNPMWASGTDRKGKAPHSFIVQGDGNLMLRDSTQ
jgi:hypothetical protein